ncbi:MAG TPA: tripartite tricarboxylate transporter substrate-binding protein, partial [Gemmatimonadales bacterium]|nr:tripartite tricarboxylate transporter substrate-binding protein [Gemmatimonadales bacterium]
MNGFALLFGAIAAAWSASASAQAWPQKPVRVLVGLAPGGNPDTLARILAAKWSAALGQQFVVENRPGAGSTVAADLTAKSPPDGTVVLISDSSVVTTAPHLFKSLPYDPFRDLQPVSLAVVVPMWLVVHPSVQAGSIQELVALARSQKPPMPYASSGNGSIHQITMERFKAEVHVDFTHVPFKGAGQSVPAMMAGDVLLGFVGYPAAASAMKTGKLRVLAFSMSRRSSLTPDVPTVAETVDPGFDMAAPLGVFVVARTPRAI